MWIGNARGTEFSKKHKTLDSNSAEFWDFSFHEIGKYDLPAFIDMILTSTNQRALHYVGNSQASTTVMALLSLRPEYNRKILTMHLMTPVIFLRNVLPWFRSLGPLVDMVEVIEFFIYKEISFYNSIMKDTFEVLDISREVFIVDDETRKTLANMCNLKSGLIYNVCKNYLFLIAGRSFEQWNDVIIETNQIDTKKL